MKTILYAPCYISPDETSKLSTARIQRWVDHYFNIMKDLGVENIILVDDGSDTDTLSMLRLPQGVRLLSLHPHLGRGDVFAHWGWWRSFTYGSIVAKEESANRLILIETDAFILTKKMAAYIQSSLKGWASPWNNILQWPETAFQIINASCFEWLKERYDQRELFWCKPRTESDCPERVIPITEINKDLIGDRYTEWGNAIPKNADFACQVGSDFVPWGLV